MKKSSLGISLISLIITIIVIIILAAIVIFSGLGTPDSANLAKFTSEFADFNLAVDNAYMKEVEKNALSNQSRSKKQVYYEIATGIDVVETNAGNVNQVPEATGTVADLEARLGKIYPETLEGEEYYTITSDTNIYNWKKQKQYFEATEVHYLTDEGEAFFLPGYLVQEDDGSQKWFINESKYYYGPKQNGEGGGVVTPPAGGEDGGEGGSGGTPEVAISSISLSETSGILTVGGSKTLTAEINADATEKLVWESSNPSVVTVTPSADTKSATITGVVAGTSVIITAKNQAGTISDTYTVTEVKEPVQLTDNNIGDFVEYGIEYTDVYYDTYTYNSKNGWRLLSQTPVGNGTYNIEIISTGIPAKVYYYYSSIGSAPWCGTDGTEGTEDQLGKYATTYYASSSNTNSNMKAAAGLLYNFEKVNFMEKATYDALSSSEKCNNGYYAAISGSYSGAGNLFKSEDIALGKMSVRSVMHADLVPTSAKTDVTSFSDRATGLFTLQNLKNVKDASERGVSGYSYRSGSYWLASPHAGHTANLRDVDYRGSVGSSLNDANGVRPVVSISGVQMDYVDGAWQIQQ